MHSVFRVIVGALVQVLLHIGRPWLVPIRGKNSSLAFGPPSHIVYRAHH
jgi:hypothetical protein